MIGNTLLTILWMLLSITCSNAASLPGSSPLTAAFAEKLVAQELQSVSAYDSFEVIVDNPRFPLGNQEMATTEIVVEGLRLEADTGRFSAILVGTIGAAPRFHLPLEGQVVPMVEVPVLSRTIGRGERIAAHDLDWIHLAPGRLPKASLTEASLIIGTEAKRRLRPGKVITNRDVGPPRLVRRGQSVRVIYADGDLRLTTLGTARDDGAFGEPIRVFNPESNLQIQGVATGSDEVSVGNSVMPGAG